MNPLGERLLFSCQPEPDESLAGFLIRLAEANRLASPYAVIRHLTGQADRPPSIQDAIALAEISGSRPDAIAGLFGLEVRKAYGETHWRIGSEWVTKPYFISSRNLSWCPRCLAEAPYLRSAWELTLYRTCAVHGIELLSTCAACGRGTTWMRSSLTRCRCGAAFADALAPKGTQATLAIAVLIEQILQPTVRLPMPGIFPKEVIRFLHALSLDALLKTVWLLGMHIGQAQPLERVPVGSVKKIAAALSVIESAVDLLAGWPNTFHLHMNRLYEQNRTRVGLLGVYGGIHRYLSDDMQGDEFRFLHLAYERHIRDLWRSMNRPAPPSVASQLEFSFS